MKCTSPVPMYRGSDGTVSHFERKVNAPTRFTPSYVKDLFFRPCQYCMNCRLRKAYDRSLRCVHEASLHSSNSFLTLTYDDAHLPPNNSLRYSDVSAFIKRFRDATDYPSDFAYYRVGEYGSEGTRPHYHLIFFGYDFTEPISYHGVKNCRTPVSSKDSRIYYKSSFLTDCWSNGFADVGDVDFATCLYVSKYVTKKLYSSNRSYTDKLPERPSSSKKFPIGRSWIEKYYSDVYPHDFVVHDGKKYPPPRFYDDWLKANKPDLFEQVSSARQDSVRDTYPNWRDLLAKHVIRVQRQKAFLRDGCAPNFTLDDELTVRLNDTVTSLHKGLF